MNDNTKMKHIIVQSDLHTNMKNRIRDSAYTHKCKTYFLDFDLHTNMGPRDFRTRRARIMKHHDLGTRPTHKKNKS